MTFIKPGATIQSVEVQVVDDTGLPVTGLVAATFPTTYYQRTREDPVQINLSDLAEQNSAYSSGGVKELTGGRYRLDVPDAAFATESKVTIIGEASGKRIIYPTIDCGWDLSGTTIGLTAAAIQAIWDKATSQLTTAGSIGKLLVDNVSASMSGLAAAVWAYATRTLTQTSDEVAATLKGTDLVIHRGDTWSWTKTGLGSISDRSKLWFTVKANKGDPDAKSVIQITEAGGLLYLNRTAAATPANGSITADDAGVITIRLDESATALLREQADLVYDVQVRRSTGTTNTLTEGLLDVNADVTRATE